MTALINMPRSAWKRQPQVPVELNPNFFAVGRIAAAIIPGRNELVSGSCAFVSNSSNGYKIATKQYGQCATPPASNLPGYWGVDIPAITVSADFGLFCISANSVSANGYSTFRCESSGSIGTVQHIDVGTSILRGYLDNNITTGMNYGYKEQALLFVMQRVGNQNVCYVNKAKSSTTTGTRTGIITGLTFGRDRASGNNTGYLETYVGGVTIGTLSDQEIIEWQQNPWQLFQPAPSRFYLIPSSGLASIYQDGLIRWHLLAATQQDAALRWDVQTTIQNEVVTRWNVLEGVLADTVLHWDSLAEIQQDSVLRWDIASALSSVQQDVALRWNLLTTAQQDVITQWNLLAAIQSDVVSRWNLLTSAQQDTIIRWNTLTTAEQDALLRWNALQSLESNQTLRWDVLSEVLSAQNDATLRWNTLSTIQQDALLRWNLAIAVEQSLATRWNLLNAVEISHAVRWNIAVEVANAIVLRWDSVESLLVSNDLNLTWNLIAVAENDIELRWNLGDSSVTPDSRIFLVRGEDRTFHLAVSDRIFGVQ